MRKTMIFDFNTMISEKAEIIINNPNSSELEKIYEGYHDYNLKWVRDFLLTLKEIRDNNYTYSSELLRDLDKEVTGIKVEKDIWVNLAVKNNKYNLDSELIVIPEEEAKLIIDEKLYDYVHKEVIKCYSSFRINDIDYFILNDIYHKCKKEEQYPTRISYDEFNIAYINSLSNF
jgi:hypothetical protein